LQFFTHRDTWWEANVMTTRDIDTIYLPDDQLNDILSDVDTFFKSQQKYRQLGIPWRRGWLLTGPPGTGKSSLVQAVASHYHLPIYYLNLSTVGSRDLMLLFRDIRRRCIILIEDIDCISASHQRKDSHSKLKDDAVQTNDLLNVLDGLIATEERLLVITTNHPEKLDQALIRDGRVDRKFEIAYVADAELKKFYDRAIEFHKLPDWKIFRSELPKECTIANAQNLLFKYSAKR
jgi:chaperone BCS1